MRNNHRQSSISTVMATFVMVIAVNAWSEPSNPVNAPETANPADLTIALVLDGYDPVFKVTPSKKLDFGVAELGKTVERSVSVKNSMDAETDFAFDVRGGVFSIDESSFRLASGKAKTVAVRLHCESRVGAVTKHAFLSAKTASESAEVQIPLTCRLVFGGAEADPMEEKKKAKPSPRIKFIDHQGGGLEERPEAVAWVFAGENCPECEFLKKELLPVLFESRGLMSDVDSPPLTVVLVDIDEKENFLFMMKMEERFGGGKDKTPVLLFENKLHFGNEAVKKLAGFEFDF